jgi:hypothetical protein
MASKLNVNILNSSTGKISIVDTDLVDLASAVNGIIVPSGSTSQEGTPENRAIRLDTTTNNLKAHSLSEGWRNLIPTSSSFASRKNSIVRDGLTLYIDTQSYSGGNSLTDLSGNGRDFNVDPLYTSVSNGITSGGNIATCPQELVGDILNTDYHSIFFAVRFNTTPTYPSAYSGSWNKIFEHNGSSGDRSPGVWRYPSTTRIHWRYNPNNSGADFGETASRSDFSTDTWFIVGVTKNGSVAKSYTNGVLVATSSVSFPKQIGSSPIRLFPGYPADLASLNSLIMYDRVLSDQEVLRNFNAIKSRYVED